MPYASVALFVKGRSIIEAGPAMINESNIEIASSYVLQGTPGSRTNQIEFRFN